MAGTLQDLLNEEIAIFLFFGAKIFAQQQKNNSCCQNQNLTILIRYFHWHMQLCLQLSNYKRPCYNNDP